MHQIRPAQAQDAEEIARLTRELGYTVAATEISARLMSLLASDRYSVFVATANTPDLLGWAVVERRMALESGERAELTGLVVSASARRTGVGQALVKAAEQWANAGGMNAICVRSDITRQASHPFYQRLGYQHRKTQHVYQRALGTP